MLLLLIHAVTVTTGTMGHFSQHTTQVCPYFPSPPSSHGLTFENIRLFTLEHSLLICVSFFLCSLFHPIVFVIVIVVLVVISEYNVSKTQIPYSVGLLLLIGAN